MDQPLRVGIIGEFDPDRPSHVATGEALRQVGRALSVAVDCAWLPIHLLDGSSGGTTLRRFDALWAAPGGPYRSMAGVLAAIRFARTEGWPFIGT
jgi:CTP synthase (UTP-ammonia lyase)